jgi:hypothetical protein
MPAIPGIRGCRTGECRCSIRKVEELGVDVRYSEGFTTPNDTPMDIDPRNGALSVILGLSFGKV